MSNEKLVLGLLNRLPEDTLLENIARAIELLAGLKTARKQACRREGMPVDEAHGLVGVWTAR